jgi:hypothetical protein
MKKHTAPTALIQLKFGLIIVLIGGLIMWLTSCSDENDPQHRVMYNVTCAHCNVHINGERDSLTIKGIEGTWNYSFNATQRGFAFIRVDYISHEFDFKEHSIKAEIYIDDKLMVKKSDYGYLARVSIFSDVP